jgi:hypothetical protein
MKTPRRSTVPPWLVPLLLLFLPMVASADERVTVVLKTGVRYERVTCQVLPQFSVLELRDGVKDDSSHSNMRPVSVERVSFTNVEAIYDADGKNIAPRLLASRYRPSEPEHVSEAPSAPLEFPPSRPWHVMFAVDGGYDLPFGDYYQGVKLGPGFGGTVHVALTSELALRAEASKLGLDFDSSNHAVSNDPDVVIVSEKDDLDALRTMIGLEYHQPVIRRGEWSGLWFLHSSFGAIRHSIHSRIRARQVSTGQEADLVGDGTDTRFAMTTGAGGMLMVRKHLAVCGSADFNGVWTKTYASDGTTGHGIKGLILGFRAGLAWVL